MTPLDRSTPRKWHGGTFTVAPCKWKIHQLLINPNHYYTYFFPRIQKGEPRPSLILAGEKEPLCSLLPHASTQVAFQHICPGSPNRAAGYSDSLKIRTVDHAAPVLSCFSHSRPEFVWRVLEFSALETNTVYYS
ncbi:hypothetical protein AVEN_184125-1 [Araneus ventricosus]|uniref:Uncharacterized protein n=1 Tax=Araneus ventricosus TaxID=182803 RepID=A0A4Y2LDR5_ARAVE|nr:hypothetical protein AVEN_184125-1 [Araneus ventricosus]